MKFAFLILTLFTGSVSFGQTAALEVVGACTWTVISGPGKDNPNTCIHKTGHALAIFYGDRMAKKVYVLNQITSADVNFCQTENLQLAEADQSKLVEGKPFGQTAIQWTDAGATSASRAGANAVPGTNVPILNEVTISTGAYNFVESKANGHANVYPACIDFQYPAPFFPAKVPTQRNVIVHFSSPHAKGAAEFLKLVDQEAKNPPDEQNTNFVKRYSTQMEADGRFAICIEAVNAANQYRIVEYARNYTELDEGKGAGPAMYTKPCP